jgi:hypothetical protein
MKLWSPHDGCDPREASSRDEELWAPHPVYAHVYVSNLGRVVRRDRLAPAHALHVGGYLKATITKDIRPYVHHLVVEVFDGPRKSRLVLHANKNKQDNRLFNLQWSPTRGLLSEADVSELQHLIRAGCRQCDIARQFGVSPSHVYYYAKKMQTR